MTIEEAINYIDETEMHSAWTDEGKEAFDLLCKEARLGALVRQMPDDSCLHQAVYGWVMFERIAPEYKHLSRGATPEQALLAAKE